MTIAACGGPVRLLVDWLLGLAGRDDPRVCILGTAAGDASVSGYLETFHGDRCRPSHLPLFGTPRPDWREHLLTRDLIFVGGGNTYALLKRLREAKLLEPIRERVHAGLPYIGSSAGSNIAGPNVLTTNDWNVVGLGEFGALGLVPFNINPHYLETDPAMAAHSETRDDRIAEYHVVNGNAVVGIEEGTAVRVEGGVAVVQGTGRVKLFRRGEPPSWFRGREALPV